MHIQNDPSAVYNCKNIEIYINSCYTNNINLIIEDFLVYINHTS